MSPIHSLLGGPDDPIACKDVAGMSVHWWPSGAVPGDLCLCGDRAMPKPMETPERSDG